MSDTDETLMRLQRMARHVEEQERAIHALQTRVHELEARAYKGPMPVNYDAGEYGPMPRNRVIGY